MKNREGFTLISVIIAVVMISIGVMALLNSMVVANKMTRVELQRTQALQLASQYIEQVRARDPWTVVTEAPAVIDSTGTVNVNGTLTRGMVVSDEGLQLLRVVVTVTPRNNTRPIRLTTLIFKVAT